MLTAGGPRQLRTGSAGGAAGAYALCIAVGVLMAVLAPLMRDAWSSASSIAVGSGITATVGCWLLIRFQFEPLYRKIEERERDLQRQSDRQEFGVRLGRALERSRTEADVLKVAMRAADAVDPQLPTEALIADSSRAHLRRAPVSAGDQRSAERPEGRYRTSGCQVVSPWDCPAMSTSQVASLPRQRGARQPASSCATGPTPPAPR